MKKLFAWASVMLAAMLAACGDNGVRSPDFDAIMTSLVVQGPSQVQSGGQNPFAQMQALGQFTTPPSTGGQTATRDVTGDVDWSIVQIGGTTGSSPADACAVSTTPAIDKATISATGLVHAISPGTVYVKATPKSASHSTSGPACKPLLITQCSSNCGGGGGDTTPVLTGLVVQPASTTIPAGTDQVYHVQGIYTAPDNTTSQSELQPGTVITWTSSNTSAATIQVQQNTTNALAHAVAVGSTTITASTTNSKGNPISGTASLGVSAAVVQSVIRVEPPTALVVVGFSAEFIACGTFSDGSSDPDGQPCSAHPTPDRNEVGGHAIANSDLAWTSSDPTIAANPAPLTASSVQAKGLKVGTTQITAALLTGHGDPNATSRSASAALNVVAGPLCKPGTDANGRSFAVLASDGASVTTDKGTLCLACSVDNPNAVIDAPPANPPSADETFAAMSAELAALDLLSQGFISITVHLPAPVDTSASVANPADPVGFIIERPAGTLVTADVLGQASIITTLNNVPNSGQTFAPSSGTDTLTVDLLGSPLVPAGIPANKRYFLLSSAVTTKFDAITLRFAPTVAGAIAALDVYNACIDVEVAPTTP